jgi:hypothetical protein
MIWTTETTERYALAASKFHVHHQRDRPRTKELAFSERTLSAASARIRQKVRGAGQIQVAFAYVYD